MSSGLNDPKSHNSFRENQNSMQLAQELQLPPQASIRAPSVGEARKRDSHFDFLKGFLVVIMVGHHTLEFFAGLSHPLIKYLDFVTGGFVFAAGFLPPYLLRT